MMIQTQIMINNKRTRQINNNNSNINTSLCVCIYLFLSLSLSLYIYIYIYKMIIYYKSIFCGDEDLKMIPILHVTIKCVM